MDRQLLRTPSTAMTSKSNLPGWARLATSFIYIQALRPAGNGGMIGSTSLAMPAAVLRSACCSCFCRLMTRDSMSMSLRWACRANFLDCCSFQTRSLHVNHGKDWHYILTEHVRLRFLMKGFCTLTHEFALPASCINGKDCSLCEFSLQPLHLLQQVIPVHLLTLGLRLRRQLLQHATSSLANAQTSNLCMQLGL